MKITSHDIIKILPLSKEKKTEFLNKFATLPADRKYRAEKILWEAYDEFYDMRFEKNMEAALLKVEEGTEKFDEFFRKRVHDYTRKEIEAMLHTESTDSELAAVRAKLEEVIRQGQ